MPPLEIDNVPVVELLTFKLVSEAPEPEKVAGKLHFFLEILEFFQKIKNLFGKMARFSPFFWKSDFSKFLIFFYSFGGRLRITLHASENYF